jgi:hypothetical protein
MGSLIGGRLVCMWQMKEGNTDKVGQFDRRLITLFHYGSLLVRVQLFLILCGRCMIKLGSLMGSLMWQMDYLNGQFQPFCNYGSFLA